MASVSSLGTTRAIAENELDKILTDAAKKFGVPSPEFLTRSYNYSGTLLEIRMHAAVTNLEMAKFFLSIIEKLAADKGQAK
jgi:hypothetical protein